jgi:hypothetical protein
MKTEPQIREVATEFVRLNPHKTVEGLMKRASFDENGYLKDWYMPG